LLAALLLAVGLGLMCGSVEISPTDVLSRCWTAVCGRPLGDSASRVILTTRLPRVLLAAAVGAALGLAGLAAQTLFRNPLASPYIVGVSSGASVGAVAGMMLVGSAAAVTFAAVPIFSVATGLVVTAAVFVMARRGRHFGHSLLLAGIAIAALCSSITAGALYLAGERLQTLVFWLMGGFWRANWRDVLIMVPTTAAALVALMLLAPAMNVSLAGQRSARDLGVRIGVLQALLLAVLSVTTAVAVSLTGIIGFVGLIVPHLLRVVIGSDHRRLVPCTAAAGAILLVLADTLARTLVAPAEIPAGILTSIVGAPIFLWLLQRRGVGRPAV